MFKERSANELIHLFSTPRARVSREKEEEILNNAEQTVLHFEGKEVKLYSWGKADRYVLLCHGWESNAGSLGAYVDPLCEMGFQVIAYDSLAHGKSEGSQSSLIVFKDIAKQIIEKKGVPEIAIGHSLGANVIILLSSEENLKIPKTILISPFNQMKAIFLGFKDILKIPDSIYGVMIEKASKRFNYNVREMEFGKVGESSPLEKILVLHDIDDKITPFSHSATMAKRWTKIDLQEVKGSGHYKILWDKTALQKGLEFIKETSTNN